RNKNSINYHVLFPTDCNHRLIKLILAPSYYTYSLSRTYITIEAYRQCEHARCALQLVWTSHLCCSGTWKLKSATQGTTTKAWLGQRSLITSSASADY